MPTRVGNGADVRREQRKQIALRGFTQCPPAWVMAQTRAESNKIRQALVGNDADARREQGKQTGLQGFTQCPPGWVMAQTYAESRENRLPCRALATAHQGV